MDIEWKGPAFRIRDMSRKLARLSIELQNILRTNFSFAFYDVVLQTNCLSMKFGEFYSLISYRRRALRDVAMRIRDGAMSAANEMQ